MNQLCSVSMLYVLPTLRDLAFWVSRWATLLLEGLCSRVPILMAPNCKSSEAGDLGSPKESHEVLPLSKKKKGKFSWLNGIL